MRVSLSVSCSSRPWLEAHLGWLPGGGAGLTGLSCALHLDRDYLLIEREANNPSGPLFVDHSGAVLPW